MYIPYLRGRRFELTAVRATAKHTSDGKILPLIEPVAADASSLERTVESVASAGGRVCIITNPQVGELAGINSIQKYEGMKEIVANPHVIPALIIHTTTTPRDVIEFSGAYSNRRVALVHAETPAENLPLAEAGKDVLHICDSTLSSSYLQSLPGSRASLRDNFGKVDRNADYPQEQFYSDDHLTFKSKGLVGFADYSIVGDHFSVTGGPAHAVAIHLHYEKRDGLWVRHFVSDRVDGTSDTAGKFAEAIAKLESFVSTRPRVAATEACSELREYHRSGHFPGLGKLKELSIRHHIETIAEILRRP